MENWREFQALVAIGFNNQFAVIELESADEQAVVSSSKGYPPNE